MITRAPRITPAKRSKLLKCFCMDIKAADAAEISKVSRPCANRWYRHYRELIFTSLRRAPRLFGDVEIDQSFFGGGNKKKIRAALKRITHLPHLEYLSRSKALRDKHRVQVLGIYQRGGTVYTHIVKKADARTLEPIIRLVVEQHSVIYSDEWRAYSKLRLDGYRHESINHSAAYSDKKGVNINGIETFWSFAKRRLAKFNGLSSVTFALHIKESEFRYNHRDMASAMKSLLSLPK